MPDLEHITLVDRKNAVASSVLEMCIDNMGD